MNKTIKILIYWFVFLIYQLIIDQVTGHRPDLTTGGQLSDWLNVVSGTLLYKILSEGNKNER